MKNKKLILIPILISIVFVVYFLISATKTIVPVGTTTTIKAGDYPYELCSDPKSQNDCMCGPYPLDLSKVPERMLKNCRLVASCDC